MHADRVTVTDLIQDLEGCDPTPRSASPSSPPGRWSTPPTLPALPSRSTSTAAQWSTSASAQLGYLPEPARQRLGW